MTTMFDPVGRVALSAVATVAVSATALAAPVLSAQSAAAAPVAMAAAVTAQSNTTSPRFALPRPTGPLAIGREVLHLVDRARPDPWVPTNPRELMVSMYYPALARPGRTAPYLTTAEARLFVEDRELSGVVRPEKLAN